MNSLSGVDFVVTRPDGSVFSRSDESPDIRILDQPSPQTANRTPSDRPTEEHVVEFEGKKYLHSIVPTQNQQNRSTTVHVFASQQSVSELWWQSAKPPLIIAAIIFPIAFVVAVAMAGRMTRPLDALNHQVQNIVKGELSPIPLPARNDEIRDLSISVNEMSARLEDFETETRNNERLQTLVKVGSGMAHNLRNCATGCKMAIELLESENHSLDGSENLTVAKRQIVLMSKYIDRFIKLGRTHQLPEPPCVSPIAPGPVVDSVITLLGPTARHLNVKLDFNSEAGSHKTPIHPDELEQLAINLITNAITATSEHHIKTESKGSFVNVSISAPVNGYLELTVTDNGPGPNSEIATRMFDPFISGSREGIGLGLSLAAEIVEQAHGEISWNRIDDLTHFCVFLPVDDPNAARDD